MTGQEKKKQPTIKTLEDKGTKVDLVDFEDGRRAMFFQIEKFRGLSIGAFRIGYTNKYAVVSPESLTRSTLDAMATSGSIITGSSIKPEDFVVVKVADFGHGEDHVAIGVKAEDYGKGTESVKIEKSEDKQNKGK